MQLRALGFVILVSGGALTLQADGVGPWIQDRAHPQVQYRVKCANGSLTIDWRNAYPGAVTLKVGINGSGYEGEDQVQIPAGGSSSSDIDTLNCYPDLFQISEKKFSMAPPPPAASPKSTEPAKPAPPPLPTVAPWVPPARLPELAPETFGSIQVGMKQAEVLRRIGNPVSKLSIPEDNALVESYRYPVLSGKVGIIRFSNGAVTEVVVQ